MNKSRWYDNLWAALMFFTRLPLWRIYQPNSECFKAVVEWWPLTGWLTGGVMALVLWLGGMFLPWTVAVLLAVAARMLLTGALHEDGLCDFFDGFGGGTSRERVLEIMKDSRIGTYGVLGVVLYVLLLVSALMTLPGDLAPWAVMAADPYAKMLSAQMVQMLPYARTEQEAKARTVYRRIGVMAGVGLCVQGCLPMAAFLWWFRAQVGWQAVVFGPCVVMYVLYLIIWRRLRGYTGDCCGAVFLLTELSVYLCLVYNAQFIMHNA